VGCENEEEGFLFFFFFLFLSSFLSRPGLGIQTITSHTKASITAYSSGLRLSKNLTASPKVKIPGLVRCVVLARNSETKEAVGAHFEFGWGWSQL